MSRSHFLDAVEREEKLEIHRVLAPQRAVVVEGGDALGWRNKLRTTLRRRRADEVYNGLLGRSVVPRRERVGLPDRRSGKDQPGAQRRRELDSGVIEEWPHWIRSYELRTCVHN